MIKKKNRLKLDELFSWLDDNLLLVLTGILLIFIPLYPKIPLAELIPGYIVRMRLEDVLVFFTAGVWLIQVLRKKVNHRSIIHSLIVLYLGVSLLSLLSALTVTQSIPWQFLHFGKSVLHWIRYLEYFMLFAITFSSVKTIKQAKALVIICLLTLAMVVFYGYGQKYHYWPVFSTMNREFSKGIRLYLTEHARVQSTFGGHYDFAGYLVLILTLALAWALTAKRVLVKIVLHILHLFGLWMLVLTASRASFAAYYIAVVFLILILALTKSKPSEKACYFFGKLTLFSLIIASMMIGFGQDMKERLFHVVKDYPHIEQAYDQIEKFTADAYLSLLVFLRVGDNAPNEDWIAVDLSDQSIADQIAAENALDSVLSKTDQRPVIQRPRPDDVYVDIPDQVKVATISATGEREYIIIEKERTWSDNALKYGLSTAIRLDTLWPNAIKGLQKNPLLGSGYATLNKESLYHFTEAESTDNNFLRSLGETGLLGFISFYGIIVANIYLAIKLLYFSLHNQSDGERSFLLALTAGYIASSIGLLVNATYIDIYASSKVAFSYWGITGILVALCYQEKESMKLEQSKLLILESKILKRLSKIKE